jgi:hypothetical protein
MMNLNLRRAVTLAVFAASTSIPMVGMARSVPGIAGMEPNGTSGRCLQALAGNAGSVRNACPTRASVYVPLSADSSGTKYGSAIVRSNDNTKNVRCALITTTPQGDYYKSDTKSLVAWFSWQTFSFSSGTPLNPYGTALVECDMDPGTYLGSVNFDNP